MSYDWDTYFYNLTNVVSENSKCMSRKIGSILVREKRVISVGYNGPPSGVPHCDQRYLIDDVLRKALKDKNIDPDNPKIHNRCPRQVLGFKSGEGLEWCIAGHSERNALINAARNGISTKGTTLYMNCDIPCTACLVEILNAGVIEIVVVSFNTYDISAEYLLLNSELKYRTYQKYVDKFQNKMVIK